VAGAATLKKGRAALLVIRGNQLVASRNGFSSADPAQQAAEHEGYQQTAVHV